MLLRIVLITAAICLVVYGLGFYGVYNWLLRTECPSCPEPECPECPQCILENRTVSRMCQLIPAGHASPETPEGKSKAGMLTPREICEQYIEPRCVGKPPTTQISFSDPNTDTHVGLTCGEYELAVHQQHHKPRDFMSLVHRVASPRKQVVSIVDRQQ